MSQVPILVVDDEPMMTEIVQIVLELELDAKVTVCNSAMEGLAALKNGNFSLVVTDYLMPDVNGVQFMQEMRRAGHEIPVLMLTGYYNDTELNTTTAQAGAFQLLEKPWNNSELVGHVRRLLG